MITVWESDISATIFIFRLKCSADAAFLSFWSSYFITWPRCKRSFVSNNWCLVWTGSAFPQSFLSCKQSDAERKDLNIPEQGHSWFYTSLRLFVSFVEEMASPSRGWRKNLNFTKNKCRSHKRFCLPAISQSLVDVISVAIARKQLKIAQVARVFQPFSFGLSVG